ncbi:S8 family peptidase [Clostridium sp. UBA5119]|uniref:S8 family peptidase n=1 Tax=Clostridium sp. UBA5119 TaxID=1946366 RepID=UPI00321717B9
MGVQKADGLLNLLINVPESIRNEIIYGYGIGDVEETNIELIILYSGTPEVMKEKINAIGGTFEDLDFGYGIVTIPRGDIEKLIGIREINYIELPKNLYLSFEPSNRASCITEVNTNYGLEGEGVLIGFIDSGIDYVNQSFRLENGDTRIDFIYDLYENRRIYTREEINAALRSPDPYSLVPHFDRAGHGTHVAGIACAGGNIPRRFYGVAPRSSIAMVKMTREIGGQGAKSTQLMRGIKFLIDRAYELNKPLVINISFSTNDGAHTGNSLLEQYIEIVSTVQRVNIVVAAGNEGDRAHHVGGELVGEQEIRFNVGIDERLLIIQLFKSFLKDIDLNLISPSGNSSGELRLTNALNQGRIGNTEYIVFNTGPTPFSIDGEIIIVLSGVGEETIASGIWTMNMTTNENVLGSYDMWLPIAEGLNIATRFLRPSTSNTVGIPGTVADVITVGSYNFINSTISPFSGRGNEELNPVKPDLVAPGENIESSTPGGGFEPRSGTSMATPHVAGACGLLMEFGIVRGNDPYLYGERSKYFLLKGANRSRIDVQYPNNSWGYGTLCLAGALRVWNNEVASR